MWAQYSSKRRLHLKRRTAIFTSTASGSRTRSHHADVTTLANWTLYRLEPGKLEEMEYCFAALVISDVEAKRFTSSTILTEPAARKRWLLFPIALNRLRMGGWCAGHDAGGWSFHSAWNGKPAAESTGSHLLVERSSAHPAVVSRIHGRGLRPDHPLAVDLPWHFVPAHLWLQRACSRPQSSRCSCSRNRPPAHCRWRVWRGPNLHLRFRPRASLD